MWLWTLPFVPIFDKIIDPIELALRAQGLSMLFVSSQNTKESEDAILRQFVRYNIAGLIVVRSSVSPETTVFQQYVDSGGKMVVVNKPMEGLSVPQVVSNDYMPIKTGCRASYITWTSQNCSFFN